MSDNDPTHLEQKAISNERVYSWLQNNITLNLSKITKFYSRIQTHLQLGT